LSPVAERFITIATEAFARLEDRRIGFEPSSSRSHRVPVRAGE
jgi:hypothetical protein